MLFRSYDFVVTSGGASVGDHDLVKQVFSNLGSIDLWRVKIKPGKPVAFGLIGDKTNFFAFPGNPVSILVTFKLFVSSEVRRVGKELSCVGYRITTIKMQRIA